MDGDYEKFLNDLDQVLNKHFGNKWEYRFDSEDDAHELTLMTWTGHEETQKGEKVR